MPTSHFLSICCVKSLGYRRPRCPVIHSFFSSQHAAARRIDDVICLLPIRGSLSCRETARFRHFFRGSWNIMKSQTNRSGVDNFLFLCEAINQPPRPWNELCMSLPAFSPFVQLKRFIKPGPGGISLEVLGKPEVVVFGWLTYFSYFHFILCPIFAYASSSFSRVARYGLLVSLWLWAHLSHQHSRGSCLFSHSSRPPRLSN